MNKLYNRQTWHNNTTPALNETNLNILSKAVDDIDDRVIEIAGDVLVVVPEILEKYADIEALATNPPYIGANGNWWTWDTDLNQYVDSGVDAGVSVTVGTTTTLPAGSSATVTNSGTDTDPILNFGIPQGATGQNGADGVGVPSGGTTGQVLKKKSGTDYDTEWADESGGGSGGHTILDSLGSAMTQRTNLQFDGADVTDDPANDKTIVTGTPQNMIGDAWASGQSYVAGQYRIDGNVLYKCKQDHTSSPGNRPPYASYWDAVSVASELNGTVTFTPNTSVISDYKISAKRVGNIVSGTLSVQYKSTISTAAWEEVGTLSFVPRFNTGVDGVRLFAMNSNTVTYAAGQLESDGKVKTLMAHNTTAWGMVLLNFAI